MTKSKHLKQLVRSRMEKTGESYASARSQVTTRRAGTDEAAAAAAGASAAAAAKAATALGSGAELSAGRGAGRGAGTAESWALATALAHAGVRAPHTGEALSEALVFGLAGGIGGAYWVFEYKEVPYPLMSVFTRHAWDSSRRFLEGALTRLGLAHAFKETGSGAAAQKALVDALADGALPLVWVSRALPADSALPAGLAAAAPHVVVVRSRGEDGRFELVDRGAPPHWVEADALAESRALVRSEKQRLLTVASVGATGGSGETVGAAGALDAASLRGATERALAACARELLEAPAHLPAMAAPNSGLVGLEKLGRLLADAKDKRGWPAIFPPGLRLFKGLTGLYRQLELDGLGALRPLYAAFLEEAATLLERPALGELAGTYGELGREWTALARMALPDEVPLLAEARALMERRTAAYLQKGAAAAPEIGEADARLAALQEEASGRFPLDEEGARGLRERLSERLLEIVQRERVAAERLRQVAGA